MFNILSLTDSRKTVYLWQKLPLLIQYVATLPCEMWLRYSEYFTFQQDRAPARRAPEAVESLFRTLCGRPTVDPYLKPIDYAVGNSARPHLKESGIEDVELRAVAARKSARRSWSASAVMEWRKTA